MVNSLLSVDVLVQPVIVLVILVIAMVLVPAFGIKAFGIVKEPNPPVILRTAVIAVAVFLPLIL